MIPKVHANQMSRSGGVQAGVKYGAISVDHLESTAEEGIRLLAGSNTISHTASRIHTLSGDGLCTCKRDD